MPNPNVGQRVASNWEAVVGKGPEDNINNDYWLFNQLSKGDAFMGRSGGDFIRIAFRPFGEWPYRRQITDDLGLDLRALGHGQKGISSRSSGSL